MRCVGIVALVVTATACHEDNARLLFTTSSLYTGDLDGLVGADAKCAQSASAAGIDGTFIALLSDATTNAIDRVGDVGPWNLTNGQVAFRTRADLAMVPVAALEINENGLVAGPPTCAWTGSKAGAKSAPEHCMNWTVAPNDMVGKTGNTNQIDSRWIEGISDCGNKICNVAQHLYCIEQ